MNINSKLPDIGILEQRKKMDVKNEKELIKRIHFASTTGNHIEIEKGPRIPHNIHVLIIISYDRQDLLLLMRFLSLLYHILITLLFL